MPDWWQRDIVDPGKLPLLACIAAFVLTFAVTRLVVRLVRAGRGPFHDVTVGSVHVHHVVPGLVLMTVGGVAALTTPSSGWMVAAAVAFGAGLALVLDEFALVLHLADVYWTEQGRTSVDAVLLVLGVLVLLLFGITPLGVENLADHHRNLRWLLTGELLVTAVLVSVTFAKGKVATGIVGVLVPPVALAGAVRLARPGSPWDRWFYAANPAKRAGAVRRAASFDKRWRARLHRVDDAVAGAPSVPSPPD